MQPKNNTNIKAVIFGFVGYLLWAQSLLDEENWFNFIWFCRKRILHETVQNR